MYQTIRLLYNRQHERILDAEEKGEQRNKSVANTVYLDIRRNELNKHTKESPSLVLAMNVIQIIVFLL